MAERHLNWESGMQDITAPAHPVEVHISNDGRLWVNVGGKCALRVCQSPGFVLIDERTKEQKIHDQTK